MKALNAIFLLIVFSTSALLTLLLHPANAASANAKMSTAATKTVNLDFILINWVGEPAGTAGPIVAEQTKYYIAQMEREGQTEIVAAMTKARDQANVAPYLLTLTNSEFSIVYTWLTDFSGFAGQARQQLIDAFNATKNKK